jgi:hypothetical protein
MISQRSAQHLTPEGHFIKVRSGFLGKCLTLVPFEQSLDESMKYLQKIITLQLPGRS